jgi:outer membrane protein OmpA-like peptidoglycan-associated protein
MMTLAKPLALSVCLAIAGITATVCAAAEPTAAQSASACHWYWPFSCKDEEKAAAQPAPEAEVAKPVAVEPKPRPEVAKESSGCHWWWPFGCKEKVAAVKPMPDPKITQAWMDQYEPRLREALNGSHFELERRDNLLVVTVPVDSSFNPDRPEMLLPVTLGPVTKIAKLLESDKTTAVLILGHADSNGAVAKNLELSQSRARAVSAIFRLSGLQRDRLMLKGVGSDMPRAANDSAEGRALNRRVEIMLTPQDTLVALLSHYNQPLAASEPVPKGLTN